MRAAGWREDLMYALREEGDITAAPLLLPLANFYPRPPQGGRRSLWFLSPQVSHHFYPRPPRGGRRSSENTMSGVRSFLSTPSMRRATQAHQRGPVPVRISIHALREEGERRWGLAGGVRKHFYPRPP